MRVNGRITHFQHLMLCITISSGENVIPVSGGFGWSKNRENVLKIEFKSKASTKDTRGKNRVVFYYGVDLWESTEE